MSESTYTVRDTATIISGSKKPEVIEQLVRQLRYWTAEGIISPVGKKHAGSGNHREYTADEVRKAAIVAELVRHGVSVVKISSEYFEGLENGADWDKAITGEDNVFFVHAKESREDGGFMGWIGTKSKKNPLWIADKHEHSDAKYYPTCLVINLTTLFSKLKLDAM